MKILLTILKAFGAILTTAGVINKTTGIPTTSDSFTNSGEGTGLFNSVVTGLTENTTYYVRAYATNEIGTAYGEEISFTTTAISDVVMKYGTKYIFNGINLIKR